MKAENKEENKQVEGGINGRQNPKSDAGQQILSTALRTEGRIEELRQRRWWKVGERKSCSRSKRYWPSTAPLLPVSLRLSGFSLKTRAYPLPCFRWIPGRHNDIFPPTSSGMLEDRPCLSLKALSIESKWTYMNHHLIDRTCNKRSLDALSGDHVEVLDDDCGRSIKHLKLTDSSGSNSNCRDSDNLISEIGRDNSISCLLRCSRSDYGALASLNTGFRSLIRSGALYRLRRLNSITEHWVYFSCNVNEWEAYDPYSARWIKLPTMPRNECFMCSDKESLAVGTELLVFGKEEIAHTVLKYSILTNSWSPGVGMNSPRCLFGSASLGEKAVIAGGTDAHGAILSSAELYNSETQTWETLPSMNRPRKMCSGVFMDKKFYVIGGMASNTELLTCGEEFDLDKKTWRLIPNMSSGLNGASGAPPLVAVVNNELYAAHYTYQDVRRYDKQRNIWITLGRLPERPVSMNGWGLAFRACGEHLVVIGGARAFGGGVIELNSWNPKEGYSPLWNMIARKQSGSFVYNCAVMGC